MELDDGEVLPEGMTTTTALFSVFDRCLGTTTKEIVRHAIADLRGKEPQDIDYDHFRSIIRDDLIWFVQGLLAAFDNYGAVLPPGVLGYNIVESESNQEIGNGIDDYWQLWVDYMAAAGHKKNAD